MLAVMSPLQGSFFCGLDTACYNHIAPLGLALSKHRGSGMIVEKMRRPFSSLEGQGTSEMLFYGAGTSCTRAAHFGCAQ